MDFLQQAVARAKSQHDSAQNVARIDEAAAAKSEPRTQSPRNISYKDTRRVNISPQHLHKMRILNPMSDSGIVSSYKILRTQILHKMSKNNFSSFAVVSANQAEGKTLTAINIAISLAQEVNHTVLLVDFDLKKPGVHQCFGFEPEYGIGDYLEGRTPLAPVLVNPGVERLVILPGRESIFNSSEVLSPPEVVSLIDDIKTRYANRIVIFDLPSMLHQDDALAISPYIDALLIVVAEGETAQSELIRTAQLIGNKPVLGTVLNKSQQGVRTRSRGGSGWKRIFGR